MDNLFHSEKQSPYCSHVKYEMSTTIVSSVFYTCLRKYKSCVGCYIYREEYGGLCLSQEMSE